LPVAYAASRVQRCRSATSPSESAAHDRDSRRAIREHQLRRHADHTVACLNEPAIAPRIGALSSGLNVVAAVHFEAMLTLPRKPAVGRWSTC
jgi:hypothetical protein